MQLSQRTGDWLRWVQITSIPLRHIDDCGKLVGIASGCFVVCAGRKFILSVRHAVQPESKGWAIELGAGIAKGTEMYWPKTFSYIPKVHGESEILDHVDFCFAEIAVDVESTYAHRTPYSVSDVRARHIFRVEDLIEPNLKGIFAFAGEVKPEMHGVDAFATELNVYPGLRFVRSEGIYHVFKLPIPHPGHDFFRGCSGAPVVDMNGGVVALVTTGDQLAGTIRGFAISQAVVALTQYCNVRDSG